MMKQETEYSPERAALHTLADTRPLAEIKMLLEIYEHIKRRKTWINEDAGYCLFGDPDRKETSLEFRLRKWKEKTNYVEPFGVNPFEQDFHAMARKTVDAFQAACLHDIDAPPVTFEDREKLIEAEVYRLNSKVALMLRLAIKLESISDLEDLENFVNTMHFEEVEHFEDLIEKKRVELTAKAFKASGKMARDTFAAVAAHQQIVREGLAKKKLLDEQQSDDRALREYHDMNPSATQREAAEALGWYKEDGQPDRDKVANLTRSLKEQGIPIEWPRMRAIKRKKEEEEEYKYTPKPLTRKTMKRPRHSNYDDDEK